METISDAHLATLAAKEHDRQAFGRLVMRHQSAVRRFFLNHTLGDVQLSDDLAQDTFVKAYVNIGSFRGTAAFSTWLLRIAFNVFYDYIRAHRETGDISPETCQRPAPDADGGTLRMDIYDALARLRPVERSCITLQLVDGLPIEKIAEVTGMPQGTIKSHLARGKEKLAGYLKRNGYDRR